MRRRLLGLAPLVVAVNSCTYAAAEEGIAAGNTTPPAEKTTDQMHLNWMDARGSTYILDSVPPPPAAGSTQETADLQAVLKAQNGRTAADEKTARTDWEFSLKMMADVIGPDFTAKNYPVTYALLNSVGQDQNFLSATLQARYHRKPPYADHPEVKNLFPLDHPDYPSATISSSRILVFLLAELFRPKTTELMQRDLALGDNRLNAGINYPSDIIAGRQLAQSFLFVVHDTPQFQHALDRAKAEIAAKSVPASK